ncbi:MAG: SCP2 sterol-binding domain-containing protein [Anaerolineaceae bacterium]
MSEMTIQKLMDLLPKAFLPEKAAGVSATIVFDLTGEKGGKWGVTIKDQTCTVIPGPLENPRLTLTADAQDVLDIFTGKLDAMKALMMGKLHMLGDMGLAMKLMGFFSLSPDLLN